MSSYTVDGYLAALVIREARTLLVEGRDDKRLVERTVHEFADRGIHPRSLVQVDTAELVRGDGAAVGNRHLVERVHAKARAEGLVLGGLVDREFRGFVFTPTLRDAEPSHRVIDDTLFWTRGHSIENYAVDGTLIAAFLRDHFAEHLSPSVVSECREAVPGLIRCSAGMILAAMDMHLLERARGIVRHFHWATESGRLALIPEKVSEGLSKRKVDHQVVQDFKASWAKWGEAIRDVPDSVTSQVVHGHLSWELVWSGVAAILRDKGAPRFVVEGTATGHTEAKWLHASAVLARRVAWDGVAILPGLWKWVLEGEEKVAA